MHIVQTEKYSFPLIRVHDSFRRLRHQFLSDQFNINCPLFCCCYFSQWRQNMFTIRIQSIYSKSDSTRKNLMNQFGKSSSQPKKNTFLVIHFKILSHFFFISIGTGAIQIRGLSGSLYISQKRPDWHSQMTLSFEALSQASYLALCMFMYPVCRRPSIVECVFFRFFGDPNSPHVGSSIYRPIFHDHGIRHQKRMVINHA